MLSKSLPVCILFLGAALCAPEHVQSDASSGDHDTQHISDPADPADLLNHAPVEKRSPHYNFGLGKRAYSYVSEYKRLPVYNFGLGKRSRPYSFGLGKRSVDEVQEEAVDTNDLNEAALQELFDQYDDGTEYEKRARPYSFGLGKRFSEDEASEEKRARMYSFGLGKRLPLYNFGLGKRAKTYSFGLGKRLSSKFNFGLGKRERDLHRFSFGLGKRSEDPTYEPDTYEDL